MGRVREYIERVREANREVEDATERLMSHRGELYPEDLNDAVCEAADRRLRVIFGKER